MKIIINIIIILFCFIKITYSYDTKGLDEHLGKQYKLKAENTRILLNKNNNHRTIYLNDNVWLKHWINKDYDGEDWLTIIIITGDKATLYEATNSVIMEGNVRVEIKNYLDDSLEASSITTAKRLEYNLDNAILFLDDDVKITDEEHTLEADKISYIVESEKATFSHNIRLIDTSNNILLTGERGIYDGKKEYAEITSKPKLQIQEKDNTSEYGTIIINSKYMRYDFREEIALASGDVNLFNEDLQAICDTTYLYKKEKRLVLHSNPEAHQDDTTIKGGIIELYFTDENFNQLKDAKVISPAVGYYFPDKDKHTKLEADTLHLYFEDTKIDSLILLNNAKVYYTSKETPDNVSNVAGNKINVKMEKDEIKEVHIIGDAKSRYYYKENPDAELSYNDIQGNEIILNLNEGELEKIQIWGDAKGTYIFSSKNDKETSDIE